MINYIDIATTKCRIPIEYRVNKEKAVQLLNKIESTLTRDDIINNDLFVLAAWVQKSFFEFSSQHDWTTVKCCIERTPMPTWDLSIYNTHSLTANGITCHNTANLPKNISHKQIEEIYMQAWKNHCKGITVYRDGSRAGVLLSKNSSTTWYKDIPDEELIEMIRVADKNIDNMSDVYKQFIDQTRLELKRRHSTEQVDVQPTIVESYNSRPKRLHCDIHRIKISTNGENEMYLALVGLNDGIPYEIFCGLADKIDLPKKLSKGILVKNGRKKPGNIATYNLCIPLEGCEDDGIVFKDVVELFANKNYGAFTRTLSLALRHGIPIHHIVEQLLKDKLSDMSSFNRVIARVLKQYIPDGTKVCSNSDKQCPECKQDTMIYMEGCLKCVNCSYSRCG